MNARDAESGFTLIELMVVVAIMAIMTAGVGLSLAHTVQRSGYEAQLDRVDWIDRQTRRLCLNHGRVATLQFDLQEQTITRADDGANGQHVERLLELPAQTRLDRFVTARMNQSDGVHEVAVSSQGFSVTYGLRFTDGGDGARWLVFCGQTGEMLRFEEDQKALSFFEMLGGGTR